MGNVAAMIIALPDTWLAKQPWYVLGPLSILALLLGLAAFCAYKVYYHQHWHHLSHLPGGKPKHWLYGDFGEIMEVPTGSFAAGKFAEHGHTYRGHQVLGEPMIVTSDFAAIHYMQHENDLFVKPPTEMETLHRFLGVGVLMAEHDQHRRQRRMVNACFSAGAIRECVPFFYQKAYELRDLLAEEIEAGPDAVDERTGRTVDPRDIVPGAKRIDMSLWVNRVAFDIIGLTGFDVDFACKYSRGVPDLGPGSSKLVTTPVPNLP
jgi:hypothetical protein